MGQGMNNKAVKAFVGLMLLLSAGLFATAGIGYFHQGANPPKQTSGPASVAVEAAEAVSENPPKVKIKYPSHPITPEVAALPIAPEYLGEEVEIVEIEAAATTPQVVLASMLGEPILIQTDFSTLADEPGNPSPGLKDSVEKQFLADLSSSVRKIAGDNPQISSISSEPVRVAQAPYVRVTTQEHPALPVQRYIASFGGIAPSPPAVAGGSITVQPSGSLTPSVVTPVPVPAAIWFLLSGMGALLAFRQRRAS